MHTEFKNGATKATSTEEQLKAREWRGPYRAIFLGRGVIDENGYANDSGGGRLTPGAIDFLKFAQDEVSPFGPYRFVVLSDRTHPERKADPQSSYYINEYSNGLNALLRKAADADLHVSVAGFTEGDARPPDTGILRFVAKKLNVALERSFIVGDDHDAALGFELGIGHVVFFSPEKEMDQAKAIQKVESRLAEEERAASRAEFRKKFSFTRSLEKMPKIMRWGSMTNSIRNQAFTPAF